MPQNGWFPGDQDLHEAVPQGTNPASNLVPYGPPLVAARASWSREDQDARQAGPERTIFTRDLVPGAPPCPVLAKEGARGGSQRTRLQAGLIPTGPGLSATWSWGDHPYPGCRRARARLSMRSLVFSVFRGLGLPVIARGVSKSGCLARRAGFWRSAPRWGAVPECNTGNPARHVCSLKPAITCGDLLSALTRCACSL